MINKIIMQYTYKYPRAVNVVDAVIFRIPAQDTLEVLLITRGEEPFKGKKALPGGHMNMDELIIDAAYRELEEETAIKRKDLTSFSPIGVYDGINRDPRARVISIAYVGTVNPDVIIKAGDDAKEVSWVNVSELDNIELAFDHLQIIDDAINLMML
jgi:8-oxo-dGTP diphosphatase